MAGTSPCLVCGEPASHFCAACQAAAYCGRECQVGDWKARHKNTCARLPAALRGLKYRLPRPGAAVDDLSDLCLTAPTVSRGACGGAARECFYIHPNDARLDALLEGLGASLVVDSALFVQLVAAASAEASSPERRLVFGVGDCAAWIVLGAAALEKSGLVPGCYSPTDPLTVALLRKVRLYGGMWLAGPDPKDRYLGMTRDGPKRLVLSQWHAHFVARLREELPLMDPAVAQQLDLLIGVDDLGPSTFEVLRVDRPAREG